MFRPELLDTFKTYTREQFGRDLLSGLIVGIVALPLAIAFAIASGVSPEKGIYTAVIAGFIISALGGSRVQIGGPTGAFIVIVYGIVQTHGVDGLIIATFLAGLMLIVMGLAGLGSAIKFIPHPLITGFTSGIAIVIFSSQVRDFLGLQMAAVPAGFIDKWRGYAAHFSSVNWYALIIAGSTVLIVFRWPKLTRKIPGSLVAIVLSTVAVQLLHLPVETISSRFGNIPASLPRPSMPHLDFQTIRVLIQPAFTIALLGGVESLLSAVVADGMTGGKHRSNTELIAQGIANLFSSLFGGIPATGAIARTATNIRNGGRTPVAGMVHALTLLVIMVFVGKWAAYIPMAALAGILVTVAYHMSEWQTFSSILKGPRSDVVILVTTFLLTVFIDLTIAIEIGMILSAFLFMRKMIHSSDVTAQAIDKHASANDPGYPVPGGVAVFEVNGPLFFGAAYKFRDTILFVEKRPRLLIIRMGRVPVIDATGIKAIRDLYQESSHHGTRLILSEVNSPQVKEELKKARLLFAIGKANVTSSFTAALARAKQVLETV